MIRIQLFEFEDFDWFPNTIRTGMTNLLVVFHKLMGTKVIITDLIHSIKEKQSFTTVVDLGSGSGGIMPEVITTYNENNIHKKLTLTLTDLHPNPGLVKRLNSKQNNISYQEQPVDATNLEQIPKGLKTMINSFHHMPPKIAKGILKSAQTYQQPLLIYEIGKNNIPTIIWWLLLPFSLVILIIMSLFMTPFVRPLTWTQLLFTYVIPIIPLCYAWDGQASLVRMYTFNDIEFLLKDYKNSSYSWEIAQAKKANGKKLGYYVLGIPK